MANSALHPDLRDLRSHLPIAVPVQVEAAAGTAENRTHHPISEADNILIDNGKIIKIRKNLTNKKSNQLLGEFIGLMKFSKSGTKIFVKKFHELIQNHHSKFQDATTFKKAYLTDMIQELIDNQIHLEPIFIKGKWCEIDTEEDLEKARKLFY